MRRAAGEEARLSNNDMGSVAELRLDAHDAWMFNVLVHSQFSVNLHARTKNCAVVCNVECAV